MSRAKLQRLDAPGEKVLTIGVAGDGRGGCPRLLLNGDPARGISWFQLGRLLGQGYRVEVLGERGKSGAEWVVRRASLAYRLGVIPDSLRKYGSVRVTKQLARQVTREVPVRVRTAAAARVLLGARFAGEANVRELLRLAGTALPGDEDEELLAAGVCSLFSYLSSRRRALGPAEAVAQVAAGAVVPATLLGDGGKPYLELVGAVPRRRLALVPKPVLRRMCREYARSDGWAEQLEAVEHALQAITVLEFEGQYGVMRSISPQGTVR